jgi:hypothetical protein
MAAVLEGRRFVGIELEPAYIEIAAARIAHHSRKSSGRPKVSQVGGSGVTTRRLLQAACSSGTSFGFSSPWSSRTRASDSSER